ncbi:MAG: hypothetical protein GY699_25600 [Desulfobacteraceae bacterium]|nr:hypothetical protein [Desulfobacteraceae bacterium]
MKKIGKDMNLKTTFFIVLAVVVLFPATGFCFNVSAHVDKTRISGEDSIFLEVEVNGGKATLDLSTIKDFKVISRGSSSSYNYINGKSERKATYQYVLIPLKKGNLKIPAIKVKRDGKIAFTQEIVIHVSDETVNTDAAKALFAKAFVTKTQTFVGEQTVYALRFFTSKRLSGLGFEKPPEFDGFSSKQFDKEKNYTQNINGILYHVTQVNYVITPETPGMFTIDPAVLIANVMVKSRRDSFFNDSIFSSNSYKSVRVATNPVNIEAVSIPPYQGSGVFSGLIGRFDIQGDVDKKTLKAGESTTFTIKISGSGNIMDAGNPEIDLDDDMFKVYDDTPVESTRLTESGYEGSKIFKKAIVPVNPGNFVIDPVPLIYFDVDQKKYQTVSIQEIKLDVIPSQEMEIANKSLNKQTDPSHIKQEVLLVNKDIFEIKEGLDVLEDYKDIDPLFFLLLLSIPAILFLGVKLFILMAKKDVSDEKVMQEKAKYHLKKAGKMGAADIGFLGHLYSSLVAFILSKGKRKGETITIKEAKYILTDANVDDAKIDQVTDLLETIESVRFGGKKIDENKANAILSQVKQAMKMMCVLIACTGIFLSVPHKAIANSTSAYIDGIKNYKDGNFNQAAIEFESIAQNNIKNPYLFYNIANAYLKSNDIGRAILWYERAKVLAPNDPDLNSNLKYANTLIKDKKDNTMNIMDVIFFWDNLIQVKTIQITAIVFSFLFFSWAGFRVFRNQKVFTGIGILFCSLLVLITAITFANYYKRSIQMNAVIILENVAVRSGVADTSTKLFGLHAGTKVSVEAQRDGYLKIQFSKGKVGWVKTTEAIVI